MPSLLLSIFFIPFVGLSSGCESREPMDRRHYDLYDEAVNLYFKPPYDRDAAIQLMEHGCETNQDLQDVTCYNLGVLLEIHDQPDRALEAYSRAQDLNAGPVYKAAIRRLDPKSVSYESVYLDQMARMIELCQTGRVYRAEQEWRTLQKYAAEHPEEMALNREAFTQPFLVQCFDDEPAYAEWANTLPLSGGRPLEDQMMRAHAAQHDFASLWDVELYLKNELYEEDSDHPITSAWQKFVEAARARKVGTAEKHLADFFKQLDQRRASADERRKALALKRAAAILIKNDAVLRRVAGAPEIRRWIDPVLR